MLKLLISVCLFSSTVFTKTKNVNARNVQTIKNDAELMTPIEEFRETTDNLTSIEDEELNVLVLAIGIPAIVILSITVTVLLVVVIWLWCAPDKLTDDKCEKFQEIERVQSGSPFEERSQKCEDDVRLAGEPEPHAVTSWSLKSANSYAELENGTGLPVDVGYSKIAKSEYGEKPELHKPVAPFGWLASNRVFKTVNAKHQQQAFVAKSQTERTKNTIVGSSTVKSLTSIPPIGSTKVTSPASSSRSIVESSRKEGKELNPKWSSVSPSRKSEV